MQAHSLSDERYKKERNMGKVPTFGAVIKEGFQILPAIFDGISSKAAERMGCKAGLVSACALTHCVHGTPDEGTLSTTDMVWSLTRMVEDNCVFPVIAEVRSGFSDNLHIMPYDLERIVKAGVNAMLLDDRIFGCGNDSEKITLVSKEIFADKITIAKKAAENTDCMILARSFATDPEEAVERCLAAKEAGAEIVGAACMHTEEDAEFFSEKVNGKKFWSDLTAVNGGPEVTVDKLIELGYSFSFITFMEKAAWYGDMDYAVNNFKNRNTVYADLHDFDGMLRDKNGKLQDYHIIFSYWKKWMPMEEEFLDMSALGNDAYQHYKED